VSPLEPQRAPHVACPPLACNPAPTLPIPVATTLQVIPAGQTVLLDVSPPRLLMLLIQGSLVFDRRDLALEATYILIQGGTLQIGTGTSRSPGVFR
jgi:hypothetical protein